MGCCRVAYFALTSFFSSLILVCANYPFVPTQSTMNKLFIIALFFAGAAAATVKCPTTKGSCASTNDSCAAWADKGECKTNPKYMLKECSTSCCKLCEVCPKDLSECLPDKETRCARWAKDGECTKNSDWMHSNCMNSCCPKCPSCPTEKTDDNCVNAYDNEDSASCVFWANRGDCRGNPTWMIASCAKECCPACTPTPQPPRSFSQPATLPSNRFVNSPRNVYPSFNTFPSRNATLPSFNFPSRNALPSRNAFPYPSFNAFASRNATLPSFNPSVNAFPYRNTYTPRNALPFRTFG